MATPKANCVGRSVIMGAKLYSLKIALKLLILHNKVILDKCSKPLHSKWALLSISSHVGLHRIQITLFGTELNLNCIEYLQNSILVTVGSKMFQCCCFNYSNIPHVKQCSVFLTCECFLFYTLYDLVIQLLCQKEDTSVPSSVFEAFTDKKRFQLCCVSAFWLCS